MPGEKFVRRRLTVLCEQLLKWPDLVEADRYEEATERLAFLRALLRRAETADFDAISAHIDTVERAYARKAVIGIAGSGKGLPDIPGLTSRVSTQAGQTVWACPRGYCDRVDFPTGPEQSRKCAVLDQPMRPSRTPP